MSSKNLLKGTLILLIMFNLFNVLNFIFQFSMARLLSLADYGIMSALFAIVYLSVGFTESIQTILTKFTTQEENKGKLHDIIKKALQKTIQLGILVYLIFLIIAIPLSTTLNIPYFLLALTGLFIVISFVIPVTRGALQGRKRFTALGWNMIFEGVIKLALAIALVWIGWRVYGAMLATVAALAAAFLFTFVPLRDITRTKTKSVQLKDLTNYTTPVFLITFIVLTFYSIDVLIAKAVFPDELAGTYAMASLLAKTIFIGTLPISKAMFPLTAGKKKSRSESPQKLFTHALALLGLCIAIALALFYFLADWIIRIFAGRVLPEAAAVLPLIAIAISLISISNLVILYKLSRGQTRGYKNFILLLIVEVFLLIHFSSSLLIFSLAFILASAIFLWASIMLLRR
ncbi:hypothetical protein CMI48_00300 [Candidatus Pacearchaeota archaeon]|nr:hypothetical protein [Candidatus Pacearchaeota archaeon]